MADEERNSDFKDSMSRSVALLTRRPLSVSIPRAAADIVVELTGDSDEEEVVDLTGDSDEEEVVDLTTPTGNTSMVVSVERDGLLRRPREQLDLAGYFPLPVTPPLPSLAPQPVSENSSEDDVIIVSTYCPAPVPSGTTPSLAVSSGTTPSSPTPTALAPHISRIITCPICMETQKNFTLSGFSLVATKCGHLFCDSCLKRAISLTHKCPTCSSKLTSKQFHRIYI